MIVPGFSSCTSSTRTRLSTPARRPTSGTCTKEGVGTFSQQEIASGSNMRANLREAEEDNNKIENKNKSALNDEAL